MAPIRLGFIGLSTQGWAANALVPPLFHPLLASKYTLTALCTRSEASAAAAAQKYSALAGRAVKAYHGEHGVSQLVHDPEVDMVAVSVKMPDHFGPVMAVIEAGKDLFVEWTPGNGYEETRKIAEAAKKKGIRVLVGAQANQGVAINKAKEIIESGEIGRVLSTSALLITSEEGHFWGPYPREFSRYGLDINNGATMLSIPIGHFIVALDYVLGNVSDVSASGTIRFPIAKFVDDEDKPTGEIYHTTSHDQVAISGTLKGKHDGVFYNVHCRGGLACAGERGRGRRKLQWIIDGEDGTIEITNREIDGGFGLIIEITEKELYLNGEKVPLVEKVEDELENVGKAWLEFAKGAEGRYTTMEDALRVHHAVDAALTSINEGKRIVL